jgi:prevent-host-death family protein
MHSLVDRQTRLDQTWSMKSVNVQQAKTHLSRLLEEAVAGEEIIIAKAGRPYVRLVSCTAGQTPRKLGGWEGKVRMADDFDETPEEIIKLFEGETPSPPPRRRRK